MSTVTQLRKNYRSLYNAMDIDELKDLVIKENIQDQVPENAKRYRYIKALVEQAVKVAKQEKNKDLISAMKNLEDTSSE